MSLLEYNGSAIIAMVGKNCVAIASDTRFGVQNQTIATDMRKTFRINDRVFIGLPGLATDMQEVFELLKFRTNLFQLREGRDIEPRPFTNMVAKMLYGRRFGPFFVEPVIAGLGKDGKPYVASMDLIGAIMETKDFVVAGSEETNLYGPCESLFRPDMEPDDLFETISQCLLNACDREAISGWGAEVHVITADGITTRRLKGRQD